MGLVYELNGTQLPPECGHVRALVVGDGTGSAVGAERYGYIRQDGSLFSAKTNLVNYDNFTTNCN